MRGRARLWLWIAVALLVGVLLITACGEQTPVPTVAPTAVQPSEPPARPTTVEPTQPPAEDVLFPPEMPSAVRGKTIFESNCMSCHGAAGDGSGLPGAADFTDIEFMRGEKPAEFFEAIRDGIAGTAMPAWADKLGGLDIWDVLYYEWTFATSPEEVAQGRELFAANCTACHGAAGDGLGLPGAANFTDQAFMSNEDPLEFFGAIRDGVSGTAMPVWGGKLSEDEIWALVNSIWTFAYDYGEAEAPTPTATELPTQPDPAVGQQIWSAKPCSGCHGAGAGGGIGPRIAGTGLSYDQVLLQVRTGAGPMPAFSEAEVSDLEVRHIYALLLSLAPPTPTPIAPPSFPTGALTTMWQRVRDVQVNSDFTKDLPERVASDDAGRLAVLKQHATSAVQNGQAAIAQANQAHSEIADENVRAVIRQVIDYVNAIVAHANTALGQDSFVAAWPHAAQMAYISRLDALPLATQAVRDAGLVGTVRIRVTDQAGRPIVGAFITVLTAHTPPGVRTDSSGRATIVNVAAVPALQVKAYSDGLVYHEVHVNLSPGATADASIALPGPSVGGQIPSVANAAIEPASGPGNATVTFRVTATDPQGTLNLADDQVFALNPDLGNAYILRYVGGNQFEAQLVLPDLSAGSHTWYFFVVDHQCNTSNILPVQYTVQ